MSPSHTHTNKHVQVLYVNVQTKYKSNSHIQTANGQILLKFYLPKFINLPHYESFTECKTFLEYTFLSVTHV